jgi:uncharacterized membrane protein YhaH (DUF805 family)
MGGSVSREFMRERRLVNILSLLFSFNGRVNRAQYWLGGIGAGFSVLVVAVLLIVLGLPSEASSLSKEQQAAHILGSLAMMIPLLLVASWISYALAWKRFHDRGKSGVWIFLPVPFSFMVMTSVFGALASGADPATLAGAGQPWAMILWLIQIWFFIELGCLPSKPGPNKYGDQPGGGSAPLTSMPGAPSAAAKKSGPAIPGMASTLASAESAMERAIAERAKQAQKTAQPSTPRPQAAPGVGGLRPATSGSFGRKVTQ